MERPIPAGLDTEYGFLVEARGAEDLVEDATEFVRAYPGPAFAGWDYRWESPRADLRGFRLDRLAFDPEDAKFDSGRSHGPAHEVRSDRILPNGARLYNDHGHPEYSTPECLSLKDVALHDAAGELAILRAARSLEKGMGRQVRAYKNNTDFHGASYGTHESHLVPRRFGFQPLFQAVLPMLVARQILTGSGKVGAESGPEATYQLSQRADFFVEPANAETLFRRPIFNTRDEPHGDAVDWIRLHVISGDACMIPGATARKIGLVRLALWLMERGEAPLWRLADPVRTFQSISRDETYAFRVPLEGGSWTDAYEIIDSYLAAADKVLDLDAEHRALIEECAGLLRDLRECPERFAKHVDWAAKRSVLETYMAEEGSDWRDPALRSYDLEYHNVDPDEGLHAALEEMGSVEAGPNWADRAAALEAPPNDTRALARGLAVSRFGKQLVTAGWRSLTFRIDGREVDVPLAPDASYAKGALTEAFDVETFVRTLKGEDHA